MDTTVNMCFNQVFPHDLSFHVHILLCLALKDRYDALWQFHNKGTELTSSF